MHIVSHNVNRALRLNLSGRSRVTLHTIRTLVWFDPPVAMVVVRYIHGLSRAQPTCNEPYTLNDQKANTLSLREYLANQIR